MNESLSFRTILTKVTFAMTSVASLMLDSTCFVLGLPLGTFILDHVPLKCHFEAFVALFRSSKIFYQNWTIRFWYTCFDVSSFGQSAILWPFSL
jgi:hypothetical protein